MLGSSHGFNERPRAGRRRKARRRAGHPCDSPTPGSMSEAGLPQGIDLELVPHPRCAHRRRRRRGSPKPSAPNSTTAMRSGDHDARRTRRRTVRLHRRTDRSATPSARERATRCSSRASATPSCWHRSVSRSARISSSGPRRCLPSSAPCIRTPAARTLMAYERGPRPPPAHRRPGCRDPPGHRARGARLHGVITLPPRPPTRRRRRGGRERHPAGSAFAAAACDASAPRHPRRTRARAAPTR